jgi:hypothetical protein
VHQARDALPQRHRARGLARPFQQIGQVRERRLVVRPLGEKRLELLARLGHAIEPLLEDRRAPQANRAECLAGGRLRAQTRNAPGELRGKLLVVAPRGDQGLDGVVGLFVARLRGRDAPPGDLGLVRLAFRLQRAREALQSRYRLRRVELGDDPLERGHAQIGSIGELGDALELAPAPQRLGIEPRRLGQRVGRSRHVPDALAPRR